MCKILPHVREGYGPAIKKAVGGNPRNAYPLNDLEYSPVEMERYGAISNQCVTRCITRRRLGKHTSRVFKHNEVNKYPCIFPNTPFYPRIHSNVSSVDCSDVISLQLDRRYPAWVGNTLYAHRPYSMIPMVHTSICTNN